MRKTRIFNLSTLTAPQRQEMARALEQGALAVLPTDTVYGIATGAYCEQSIEEICQLKKRSQHQPLQFLIKTVEQVRRVAVLSVEAEKLAQAYWPGALTLILPAAEKGRALLRGFDGLGIRVPAFAFLQQLLQDMPSALACTSANEHGQAVLTHEEDLVELFSGKVDFIVRAGTLSPVASSVVDLTQKPRLLREGVLTRESLETVMGCTF